MWKRFVFVLVTVSILPCCNERPTDHTIEDAGQAAIGAAEDPSAELKVDPYSEAFDAISLQYPEFLDARPQRPEEFRSAGNQISDIPGAVQMLDVVGLRHFESPVDYEAAGTVLLPHLESIRGVARFSIGLLARAAFEGDWEAVSVSVEVSTKAIADLSGLPTLVEHRASMGLATELFRVVIAFSSHMDLPDHVAELLARKLGKAYSACVVGGLQAIEATRERYRKQIADPSLLPDLHRVDRREIARNRKAVEESVADAFQRLHSQWQLDTPNAAEFGQHIGVMLGDQRVRPFVAGLDRYLEQRSDLDTLWQELRATLRPHLDQTGGDDDE